MFVHKRFGGLPVFTGGTAQMVSHVGDLGDARIMHVVIEVNPGGAILKDASVRLRTPPISESISAFLVQRNIRS